ncbi:MAG: hypothetical protein IPI34_07105 [bacterium]|nr:hypothetical protein [bacterium]
MTNVASQPRYFSILCTGSALAGDLTGCQPREQRLRRQHAILRLERLWALANVFASSDDNSMPTSGIRGISYAQTQAGKIETKGAKHADSQYQLLSRQIQYGAIGMYGAVAGVLRFWDSRTMQLTPDLGDKLGKAFLRETKIPAEIQRAALSDEPVPISMLTEWGNRAHISSDSGDEESDCLNTALHLNPVRSRMARTLFDNPAQDDEPELIRIQRIVKDLTGDAQNADLQEGCTIILCYEKVYRLLLMGFERLLRRCKDEGEVPVAALRGDRVFGRVRHDLPRLVDELLEAIDRVQTAYYRNDHDRLDDVRWFVEAAAQAAPDSDAFVRALIVRHRDVQQGKIDKGRRKLPWIDGSGNSLRLTLTHIGGRRDVVEDPDQIAPHYYRLAATDNLIRASRMS